MTRFRSFLPLACAFILAGVAPAFSAPAATRLPDDVSTLVAAPYSLSIRSRTWDGNTHGMPSGRAVLEADGHEAIWEVADVTRAAASADGSTVALLTGDFQVFVSRLPETPRRIEGGPYLVPALSSDGTFLVVQRLGQHGHILEKTFNTRGIALINLDSGEDRLLLAGNDLYSPSFASDERVFFGSGGKEGIASLYLLDLASMRVARVTNRETGKLQTFPSDTPRIERGTVVYRADGKLFRVPEPAARDFAPARRFDARSFADEVEEASPDFGTVKNRRPNTQNNNPPIFWYYDQNRSVGQIKDWNCQGNTYDQHLGTDINQSMGFNVVAPASGEVIIRNDGCANSNSPGCGQGFGNWVAIKHSDRTVTVEAHGMSGTVVGFGFYACGATLMKSASSGNSSTPHIHHESWTNSSNKKKKYDPYQGTCDPTDPSKWSLQGPYLGLPGTTCSN